MLSVEVIDYGFRAKKLPIDRRKKLITLASRIIVLEAIAESQVKFAAAFIIQAKLQTKPTDH